MNVSELGAGRNDAVNGQQLMLLVFTLRTYNGVSSTKLAVLYQSEMSLAGVRLQIN